MRAAQCEEALESLRNQLAVKSRYLMYKGTNVRHQGPNTKARALLQVNEAKICVCAECYHVAYNAWVHLAGSGHPEWRELRAEDIVMQLGEDVNGNLDDTHIRRKESRRTASWIWTVQEQLMTWFWRVSSTILLCMQHYLTKYSSSRCSGRMV